LVFVLHVAVIIHSYASEVWQRRASSRPKNLWIPAFAGMTTKDRHDDKGGFGLWSWGLVFGFRVLGLVFGFRVLGLVFGLVLDFRVLFGRDLSRPFFQFPSGN